VATVEEEGELIGAGTRRGSYDMIILARATSVIERERKVAPVLTIGTNSSRVQVSDDPADVNTINLGWGLRSIRGDNEGWIVPKVQLSIAWKVAL
jgi:hypothetical protein